MFASALALAPLLAVVVQTAPAFPPPTCDPSTVMSPSFVSQPHLGTHTTLGTVTCPGNQAGCSLGYSNSFTVTVGVDVGTTVTSDLKEIMQAAGLSIGFSYSTAKGTVNSGAVTCPKGTWTCAIKIIPWVKTVKVVALTGHRDGKPTSKPFVDQFPQLNGNHEPYVQTEICSCPNLPGSKAKGAPAVCPEACG